MFNDENLVREPREVEGYFEARNNRETGILVGQYLKATPIEQRREAQEDRPEYENKERAEEITKRLPAGASHGISDRARLCRVLLKSG
jgi:hypothetical protein